MTTYVFKGGAGEVQQATLSLRFMNGRLQQLWEVKRYSGVDLVDVAHEWRDVPDATPAPREEPRE